jgi:hypothetical protein
VTRLLVRAEDGEGTSRSRGPSILRGLVGGHQIPRRRAGRKLVAARGAMASVDRRG